ncbi:TPA: AzlC family ABC transporter permease [Yersinia enterocolitica]
MQSQTTDSPSTAQPTATFIEGITDSLPIVIGYLPVAFAFGLSSVKLGFTPWEGIFFSCIIYAGASQFVITALLSAGMSLWVSALTVMAMDVRHILYGPALKHRIVTRLSGKKTALWAFGLTDEVFAAATTKLMKDQRRWSENWMLGIAFTSWLSWVAGTAIGAMFGNGPLENYPAIEASLSFMLPALFLSFLLASFKRQYSLTVIASLTGALLGVLLFSIPVAILAGIGGGCLAALLQPVPETVIENNESDKEEPKP